MSDTEKLTVEISKILDFNKSHIISEIDTVVTERLGHKCDIQPEMYDYFVKFLITILDTNVVNSLIATIIDRAAHFAEEEDSNNDHLVLDLKHIQKAIVANQDDNMIDQAFSDTLSTLKIPLPEDLKSYNIGILYDA